MAAQQRPLETNPTKTGVSLHTGAMSPWETACQGPVPSHCCLQPLGSCSACYKHCTRPSCKLQEGQALLRAALLPCSHPAYIHPDFGSSLPFPTMAHERGSCQSRVWHNSGLRQPCWKRQLLGGVWETAVQQGHHAGVQTRGIKP